MKICKDCGISKELKKYHTYVTKAGDTRYRNRCIPCVNLHRRHYYKENDHVREQTNERRRKYRIEIREKMAKFLHEASCVDCGASDSRVLEFDHREDEEKDKDVSALLSNGAGWERIQSEIDKCDVVCANCHRIRTYERAPSYRSTLGG